MSAAKCGAPKIDCTARIKPHRARQPHVKADAGTGQERSQRRRVDAGRLLPIGAAVAVAAGDADDLADLAAADRQRQIGTERIVVAAGEPGRAREAGEGAARRGARAVAATLRRSGRREVVAGAAHQLKTPPGRDQEARRHQVADLRHDLAQRRPAELGAAERIAAGLGGAARPAAARAGEQRDQQARLGARRRRGRARRDRGDRRGARRPGRLGGLGAADGERRRRLDQRRGRARRAAARARSPSARSASRAPPPACRRGRAPRCSTRPRCRPSRAPG